MFILLVIYSTTRSYIPYHTIPAVYSRFHFTILQRHENKAVGFFGFDLSFVRRRRMEVDDFVAMFPPQEDFMQETESEGTHRDLQIVIPDVPDALTVRYVRCTFEENKVSPPGDRNVKNGILTGVGLSNRIVVEDSLFIGNQYDNPSVNVGDMFTLCCFFLTKSIIRLLTYLPLHL